MELLLPYGPAVSSVMVREMMGRGREIRYLLLFPVIGLAVSGRIRGLVR
jgi:hypothetical protein